MSLRPFKWWANKTPVVEIKRSKTVLHSFTGKHEGEGLTVNPYVGCAHRCCYCYATYEWAPEFYDKIVAKINAPEVLESQLKRWKGQRIPPVFFASATDSYQPGEGVYRLTRRSIQVLQKHDVPYYIFTKSGTVLRDLDLHAGFGDKCLVVWSITTIDDSLKKMIEPNVTPTKALLGVMRRFSEKGVKTAVNIAPVIPGLTDGKPMLEELSQKCVDAGARYVSTGVLRLRDDIWSRLRPLLESIDRRDPVRFIQALYYSRPKIAHGYHHAAQKYIDEITSFVQSQVETYGGIYGIPIRDVPGTDSSPCQPFNLSPKKMYEEISLLRYV
ncbi:MAG: radical SAM protein [Thaumarchaeota archaeon]|nr:radical SAM protein [Nitrososphaerota archaeon]